MLDTYQINPNLIALLGQDSLTDFEFSNLSSQLKKSSGLNIQTVKDFYLFELSDNWESISEEKKIQIFKLLQAEAELKKYDLDSFSFISPRQGVQSPWSSKTLNIFESCGLSEILKIEKLKAIKFSSKNKNFSNLENILFDPLTESYIEKSNSLNEIFFELKKKKTNFIKLKKEERTLELLNSSMGLALNNYEIDYLTNNYEALSKEASDTELMMFSQINSEHCRHKIFNSTWVSNEKNEDNSLFDFIKSTYQNYSNGILSAYSDNAAVLTGLGKKRFYPDPETKEYKFVEEKNNFCIKVETHNHPTAIAPFSGAATGSGGEIRDEGATGRGAKPKAGLCGFSVSYLRIPSNIEKWEGEEDKPERLASPLQIMTSGPLGAASFNNEFGRPNILGYFRSFEHKNENLHFGFHKPIMLAGGLGNIKPIHTNKSKVSSSAKIIVLGGPGYLIGLGGGSASSVESGKSNEELDFASVQRSNPEMQRRCQEVIDQCWQLDEKNPIAFIHDVGAGGLSNAIPELAKDCNLGATIDLNKIPIVDKSMSSLEIWCNESQERYVLAIEEKEIRKFKNICEREKCPFSIVGSFTEEKKLLLRDKNLNENSINLDMNFIFGAKEQLKRNLIEPSKNKSKSVDFNLDIKESILDVLRHPTVGSKNFLITIGDRNVGGLTYRDQLVGPYQVPVADNGITMSNFDSLEGEAMAIGERSPLALEDAIASGRIAITEALTNILSSGVEELSKVKLSANWMASPNTKKNNFDLYHTVKSISEDLCKRWNITIPVGKDSLSMETAWDNKKNTSPQSLIVSAFSQIPDVTKSITPDFVKDEELVVAKIDFSSSKHRLGGSILSEVLKIDLGEVPDIEAVKEFPKIFNFFAKLLQERKIYSYHDISDGGLVSCLIEMMISGNVGFKLKTEKTKKELSKFLFSEELGFVFQASKKTFDEILSFMDEIKSKTMLEVIGHTIDQEHLEIVSKEFNESIDLKTLISNWTFVTTKIQTLRDNPACALEEASGFAERETNKLVQKTTFKGSNINISFPSNPKIAVIREQGINGQVEMSAAFTKAGFKVLDVHMTDLKNDLVNLNEFVGVAFPGGFSYGDVLGAGRGWANSILMNSKLRDQFEIFFNRSETFSLGVCNGCQVLSELKEIIPGAEDWPSLKKNVSNQFEARLVQLKVNNSKSIFFKNMEKSQLIVPVAHGEGRMDFSDLSALKKLVSNNQIPLQYVNSKGKATEKYPANPNGSPDGISSICSKDGRATILMPHPERAFLNKQLSWTDADDSDSSPWFEMFLNARKFIN